MLKNRKEAQPSETRWDNGFPRVLKEKELRRHGEYRTRRLVLEAWQRLQHGHLGAATGE